MKYCEFCGNMVNENAGVCMSCGATLTEASMTDERRTYSSNGVGAGDMGGNSYNYGNNQYNNGASQYNYGNNQYNATPSQSANANIPLGIVGAVIGLAAGALLWYFMTSIEINLYINGAVLVALPCILFNVFSKSDNFIAVIAISVIGIVCVYPCVYHSAIVEYKSEYNEELESYAGIYDVDEFYLDDFSDAKEVFYHAIEEYNDEAEMIKRYVIGMISAIIGAGYTISNQYKIHRIRRNR